MYQANSTDTDTHTNTVISNSQEGGSQEGGLGTEVTDENIEEEEEETIPQL